MTQLVDLRDLGADLRRGSENAAPEELWCEGNLQLLSGRLASIVGTRDISPEGVQRTRKLTTILVKEGFCVVSGLAKGVDRVAHETALSLDGSTIAVMGTPIDECYPAEHRELKEEIARRGLVLSQFAPGTPIRRSNFPRRNVLMARISSTTFVVEAGIDSGTQHQVRAAVQMGKKVAFLASLVSQDYPWVQEAVETGCGVIIRHAVDAVELLREVRGRTAADAPADLPPISWEQDEFEMPTAALSRASYKEIHKALLEPEGADVDPNGHFQTDFPLEVLGAHKPTFFERIWSLILGATAKH